MSSIFLKFEILIFLLSFFYILYFFLEKVYKNFFKISKRIKKEKIQQKKSALNKVNLSKKTVKKSGKPKKLTPEEKGIIKEILKRVRLNIEKGYFDSAKVLIVEGLSIDKFNKDLNLELASIYEKEKKYENASYIYRDMLEVHDDYEISKKLAYMYALENDLDSAFNAYEIIHKKRVSDDEVIEMLAEISFNRNDYENTIKYTKFFLKNKPRNVEKLSMLAVAYEKKRQKKKAMETHKRILELQPYNTFSRDKYRELEEYIQ